MALNFDNLPTKQPSEGGSGNRTLLEAGCYETTIKDAKMVASKTEGAPDYMQVMFQIKSGAETANVFDNIIESDKPLPLFKLGQLLRSLGIHLQGEFNLKDLPKIIVGKRVIVAIKREKKGDYPEKNIVDAFHDEVFMPVAKSENAATNDAEECPFTMGGGDSY